jgi:SWI/SNF-related matrix-associated actin-dependent regulator of chromatin subfamily A-like protein 1
VTQLFPYQQEGVDFLAGRTAALLADDPGLGKSIQAIRAADKARVLTVLVVCPAGVVENWKREIAKFRTGDWTAYVTSYDRAAGKDHARLLAQEWDVLVLDEAHYLKNLSTKRSKKIYGDLAEVGPDALAGRATHVWALTGTPMPNDASELFPHLRALAPETITSERTGLVWTYFQFIHAYCAMRNTGFGERIVGSRNEEKLHAKLQGFMLRRRKADVLKDLPPLRFGEVYLEGDTTGLDLPDVDVVRRALAEEGVAGLRRCAANGSISTLRRLTGLAKAMPAADWIETWLESTPAERKIVVFFHHYAVGEALYDRLHRQAVRVHGGLKSNERQASIDRLQNDPSVRVFLGQITAAGTGITLTAASDLLFVESSFVPAEMEQAAMRIHRIGQTEPCLVRFAMLSGSIDEDIQRALLRKTASIGKVVDGL